MLPVSCFQWVWPTGGPEGERRIRLGVYFLAIPLRSGCKFTMFLSWKPQLLAGRLLHAAALPGSRSHSPHLLPQAWGCVGSGKLPAQGLSLPLLVLLNLAHNYVKKPFNIYSLLKLLAWCTMFSLAGTLPNTTSLEPVPLTSPPSPCSTPERVEKEIKGQKQLIPNYWSPSCNRPTLWETGVQFK